MVKCENKNKNVLDRNKKDSIIKPNRNKYVLVELLQMVFVTDIERKEDLRMDKKRFVDAEEICRDWEVSRATAYRMIRDMNEQLRRMNPNLIVIAGKVNRQYYEECCTVSNAGTVVSNA